MRCPSCGTEQTDPSAPFCPSCGRPLGSSGTEATTRLTEPDVRAEPTAELRPAPRRRSAETPSPFGPRRALYDFGFAVRRSLVAGGWMDAASAAFVGVLALLCVGAVFLIAAKLQYSDVGAGSNPLSILSAIVVLALGSLRVPLHVGDLTITALPLGALVASALAVSWAVEPAVRRREAEGLRARVAAGAKISIPFGLLCWGLALIFRFRGGATPTHAGALGALLLGVLWGAAFGALGGLRSAGPLSSHVAAAGRRLKARKPLIYEAVRTGVTMLVLAFTGAAAAGLVWVIAGLSRGAPVPNFGGGDAVAGFVYVLAFLPNILIAILTIGFGGPLDVGAQITVGGRQIGPLKTLSLWHWGGAGTPWFAYALLLLPLLATLGGGYLLHRRAHGSADWPRVAGIAALMFAATCALIAWLGRARLGAGLVRTHGFAHLAANPLWVLVLALVWGVVGGTAGWMLGERAGTRSRSGRAPANEGAE